MNFDVDQERNEGGSWKPKGERVVLSDQALVKLVNEYIQRYRTKTNKPNISAIREKLGWQRTKWEQFCAKFASSLIWDHAPKFAVLANEDTDDNAALGVSLKARGIDPSEIEQRIKVTYGALRADLRGIGLTTEEINGALAMQNFGEHRFANAMEMISAGVFGMAVRLQTRQKEIEERLKSVRDAIEQYGTMASMDRDNWVKEEDTLIRQYGQIGKLLSDIQRTWYEGSAQLALVRMRMRDEQGATRTVGRGPGGKPGFSPRVMQAEEKPSEAAPQTAAADLTPSWP